ncbi:hypothetical protein [Borreliella lusitaniae]|nr:hypothetical protein [Borreliella lusitaniae]WNY69130.1 hypothetical protein QIA44_04690 [Borreliella lusitaniae]
MKRLNKIKSKECYKFLIKVFAIKNNLFEWLSFSSIKDFFKLNIFLLSF